MTSHKNFYHTLGLLSSADDVVIKAAYKALAQKHHPDKYKTNKEAHTQIMAELNAAYAAIGTKAKRKAYDESLAKATSSRSKPKSTKAAQPKHDELIDQLQNSAVDEMTVVTLFEQVFSKNIRINSGWVNTYTYTDGRQKITIGFAELKSKIVEQLKQQ
jgi:DnaJ-class molecular chaperone